ncbi:hypothetical protein Tcan_04263 [Toxocara canis]|uniref:Uncharacterized protein n=1 Tax=Toxocara canis TaxID=6265 RepID=A0A0B2VTZ6_TOXCA|nr:hypothetical protein Tcan_04263 [Toxocara canis]
MNSLELSMLLYDKGETGDELKCAKFDGNDMHRTQHNGVDIGNDESSDSSCGAHDENLRNSASSIDTVVMMGEAMGSRVASSLSSKADTEHIPFVQAGCSPSGSALLNGTNGGAPHYPSTLPNGGVMNTGLPHVSPANIRFPSGLHKMKREWRVVGWFTSDAAMNEVRKREKVSKRKSVAQINGTKVFYRCNNWRRTNCNFRMYALYHAPDQITLYASGEHDHTTKNPHYVPRNYTGNMIYSLAPSSSQQQALGQFVMHAAANASSLNAISYNQENVDTRSARNESAPSSDVPPYLDSFIKNSVKNELAPASDVPPYLDCLIKLNDGRSIAQLLQLATQIDHTFTFNSRRNSEYCFESNAMRGKVIAFIDLGDVVSVVERCNGVEKSCEQWRKADWNQFLWAVRGKCSAAAKSC